MIDGEFPQLTDLLHNIREVCHRHSTMTIVWRIPATTEENEASEAWADHLVVWN